MAFAGGAQDGANVPVATSNATTLDTKLPQPPVLSLPKTGSVHGMGEKFKVNSNTGLGSCSIPIATSSARGVQPTLTLEYSSGGRNSTFGLGWDLSIPRISRKTSRGMPRYEDGADPSRDDVFLLEGHDDLVPVFKRTGAGDIVLSAERTPQVDEQLKQGFIVRRYMPRIESAFVRIERWQSSAEPHDLHWVTVTGDNQTAIYGRTTASRICDPLDQHRTFAWLLCEVYDQRGNAMLFEYKSEDSSNIDVQRACEANRTDASRRAAKHIKRIRYGNTVPNRDPVSWDAQPTAELLEGTWCFTTVFDYGDHENEMPMVAESRSWSCRDDPFSSCRSGFDIRTYRLCRRILTFHHFDSELGAKDYLVRSTDLTYDENETATLLVSAIQSGYTISKSSSGAPSYTRRSLPAVSFDYSTFPSDVELASLVAQDIDSSSSEGLPIGIAGPGYQWIDLHSEGLSGILVQDGRNWYYKRNTSASNLVPNDDGILEAKPRFEPLQLVPQVPSFSAHGSSSARVQFGDVAGAGKLDVVVTIPGAWGYFEREDNEGWTDFRTFPSFPPIDTSDKDVRFLDLSGDGLPDILICSDLVYTWFPSLGREGYGPPSCVAQLSDPSTGPHCLYSDPEETIHFADMTGDGLADLVRVRNSDVCYWPNVGYGRFGSQVSMEHAPRVDADTIFNEGRVQLIDLDGSGPADLLYLHASGAVMYQNYSGNGFSGPRSIGNGLRVDDMIHVSVVDLLGNGTASLVWNSALPSDASQSMRYVDIFRGQKPRLLTRMSNGMGSETRITYAPSTRFYLQAQESNSPWKTKLPFPVHCVERVDMRDSISDRRYTNLFAYWHGFYDSIERDFRGFGMTETWDCEEFLAPSEQEPASNQGKSWRVPPVHTKTWFHTGVYLEDGIISRHMSDDYFQPAGAGSGAPIAPFTLSDSTSLSPSRLEGESLREACRALGGRLLRSEVYADDGSDVAHIPYTTEETSYRIEILQEVQDANKHCVFAVDPHESIKVEHERDVADARVHHTMVLQRDRFGHVMKSIDIAYGRQAGRSPLDPADIAKQETPILSYVEVDYTQLIDGGPNYILPRVCEKRQYEITGFRVAAGRARFIPSDFDADDFAPLRQLIELSFEDSSTSANALTKRCVSRSRVLFRRDDLAGLLPKGQIQPLGLPGLAYKLNFTPGLIEKVFKRQLPARSVELLIGPGSLVLTDKSGTGCGYVDLDGDGNLWSVSDSHSFSPEAAASPATELAAARASFFTARRYTDPFGHATVLEFDQHYLFPLRVIDPSGNQTTNRIDYRALNVNEQTDANGNRQAVAYDAFGLPSGTAYMGKSGEHLGDSLEGFAADVTQDDLDQFYAHPTSNVTNRLLGTASSRTLYDYQWVPSTENGDGERPPYFATITRTQHVNNLPPGEVSPVTITICYLDGVYSSIQKKALDSPGPLDPLDEDPNAAVVNPRWSTSGWVIFNNKEQAVREYEPFFSDTHAYTPSRLAGPAATLFYDPMGRRVAALHPNKAFEKTEFRPWQTTQFDAVDNIIADPRTDSTLSPFIAKLPPSDYLPTWHAARIHGALGPDEQAAASQSATHANTPTVIHLDVLGRVVASTADNGPDGLLTTRTTYDFQSNVIESVDALGRVVTRASFDMTGTALWRTTMDKGSDWALPDATGNVLTVWNSRGARFSTAYDVLRRPLESRVQDETGRERVVQQFVYGDTLASPDPDGSGNNSSSSSSTNTASSNLTNNMRGRVVRVNDEAGVSSVDAYDFKGNPLRTSRRIAVEYKESVDWSQPVPLEPTTHESSVQYDALNRPFRLRSADGTEEVREYDEAGRLQALRINLRGQRPPDEDLAQWPVALHSITYSAKGHAVRMTYGNGISVQHRFDAQTGELRQMVAMRASGERVQDCTYTYDPVGNVTSVVDAAQQAVFFRNARVDSSSRYKYDATYQLVQATGREDLRTAGTAPTAVEPPIPGNASTIVPDDGSALARYTETYTYDGVGNILSVRHAGDAAQAPGWTRTYSYAEPSQIPGLAAQGGNRLSKTQVGDTTEVYGYTGPAGRRGHLTAMPQLARLEWDVQDRLRCSARQRVGGDGATPETTYYVYGSDGQRVRKVTEAFAPAGQVPRRLKETLYIGNTMIFRRYGGGGGGHDEGDGNNSDRNGDANDNGNGNNTDPPIVLERHTYNLQLASESIALYEARTVGDDGSPAQQARYMLHDLTGSARAEFDDTSQLLSYEEYAPYGASTYRGGLAVAARTKRYRFAGKERDEESGLCYFGARYYAPWLGRWTSPDPAGLKDGPNAYRFVRSRPSCRVDPDGRWSIDVGTVAAAVAIGAIGIAAVALTGGAVLAMAPAAASAAATILGGSAATVAAVGAGATVVAGVAADAAVVYGTYTAVKSVAQAAETISSLRRDVNPATGEKYTDPEASQAVAGVILDVGSAAATFAGAPKHFKGSMGGGGGGTGPQPMMQLAAAGGARMPVPRATGSAQALTQASTAPSIPTTAMAMAAVGAPVGKKAAAQATGGGGGGSGGGGSGGGTGSGGGGGSSGGAGAGGKPPVVRGVDYGFHQQRFQQMGEQVGRDVQMTVFQENWAELRKMGVSEEIVQAIKNTEPGKRVLTWKGVMGTAAHQVLKLRVAMDPVLGKVLKWVGDTPGVFKSQGIGGKPDFQYMGVEPWEFTTRASRGVHEGRPGWEGNVSYSLYQGMVPHWWWWPKSGSGGGSGP
ncbi:uncharacterized protein HMPREF1541_03107 [Cyphellophora europaea CBS 101466]|uniref:Insecticide toxin TcdB middle/N-terminal domain-containing protein n=1 Tax=Cyphellophora europaea (strain CBS 101466) TaxID=1220924 RepID=W2RXJ1_CYPE1|nr:uncharacterized protein HMPREF1541_03107 [Cyphellophora europaea CBS 101466]ETN41172.1 hypothetical protein HMPREF1541_03107 [Cyphellophora europaea CBS 101466]